jgi:hypothetical protein
MTDRPACHPQYLTRAGRKHNRYNGLRHAVYAGFVVADGLSIGWLAVSRASPTEICPEGLIVAADVVMEAKKGYEGGLASIEVTVLALFGMESGCSGGLWIVVLCHDTHD